METNVLAEEDLVVGSVDGVDDAVTNAIFKESDLFVEKWGKLVSDWLETHFGVFLAIGSAEVGQQNQRLGIVFGDGLNSW